MTQTRGIDGIEFKRIINVNDYDLLSMIVYILVMLYVTRNHEYITIN